MRRVSILLIAFALFVPMTAPRAENVVRITTSSNTDATRNGVYVWVKAFSDAMMRGGFRIVLFPNSALGKEEERTDLLQQNLIQMNVAGGQEISAFSPLFGGLELPFLFDGYKQLDNLFHRTPFLTRVNEQLVPHGFAVVDAALLGGMGGLFNTRRPIRTLDDLKGLRLRAMEASQLQVIRSWGVPGTQVAWEEVPQALQTGVADGYINPPLVPVMFGHTSQIKFFTALEMAPAQRVVVASRAWLERMDARERRVFRDAVLAARTANRAWTADMRRRELAILQDAGVTITTPTARARLAFVEATRARYGAIAPREIVDALLALLEQAKVP